MTAATPARRTRSASTANARWRGAWSFSRSDRRSRLPRTCRSAARSRRATSPKGLRSLRGLTTFEETFFDPDLWVHGRRQRAGFELRWRPGPFSLKSEYIRVTTERRGQSVEDTDLSPLLATGWYVSGTWAITGENKADGLNKPRRPFMRGGFGAFEVGGANRRSDVHECCNRRHPVAERARRPRRGEQRSCDDIGANWYLNQWVKIQLNAIRETRHQPASGVAWPRANRPGPT